jgi:hypothetical protein
MIAILHRPSFREVTNIHHNQERFTMAAPHKTTANPQVDVKIVKVGGKSANWFVKPLTIGENTRVVWHCGIDSFIIWFPKNHNPLANGNTEIYGKNGKASAVVGTKTGTYHYCILVVEDNGDVHLVEGNSPPTMVIE